METPVEEGRYALFLQLLDALDEGCRLMEVYDAMPHRYGGETLYQAESHTIALIGRSPGITVTDLAAKLQKTPSACSQMVRRLREKIEENPAQPEYISTETGIGYRMVEGD